MCVAYPDLREDGRECITLNHYLSQIDNPQIAFSVKQCHPKSILEAVTATIELESFLLTIPNISGHEAISIVHTETVQEYDAQDGQMKLTEMLVKLVEKLDQLEQKLNGKKILQHLKQRRKGRRP